MWNMSKMVYRRTQGTTDSGHVEGTLLPDSLSLVWGCLVHFTDFPILQFLKLCALLSQFSSDFVQTLYKVS